MTGKGWISLLLLALAGFANQDEGAAEALRSRVIAKMRLALGAMPNFVCEESITRTIGDGTPVHFKTRERLRLQVALVQGKEVFSWPGTDAFERNDPSEIIGSGLTGVGDFAGFSTAVFARDAPLMTAGTEEDRGGKRAVRYDFSIALGQSGYVLRSGPHHAVVDYGGSFWVDPATERVLALEVVVDGRRHRIPPELDMFQVKTLLEYRYEGIGGEELPLARRSSLMVSHLRSSIVTNNVIEFSGCRKYSAESRIEFGEPAGGAKSLAPLEVEARLPAGLSFEVALESPIGADLSAGGDAISAALVHPVRIGRREIPKTARLTGRILRVNTDLDRNTTHVRLGFSHLVSGGLTYPFHARFVTFKDARGVAGGVPKQNHWVDLRDVLHSGLPDWRTKADFTLLGSGSQMPRGFRMEWVTE